MTHGDLIPGNLVVRDGRLVGVLDPGLLGPADPALDLIVAWHALADGVRDQFRRGLDCSDLDWERGKAWAFEQSIGLVVLRRRQSGDARVGPADSRTNRRILTRWSFGRSDPQRRAVHPARVHEPGVGRGTRNGGSRRGSNREADGVAGAGPDAGVAPASTAGGFEMVEQFVDDAGRIASPGRGMAGTVVRGVDSLGSARLPAASFHAQEAAVMPKRINDQLKERAVRLVVEHHAEYPTLGVGREQSRRSPQRQAARLPRSSLRNSRTNAVARRCSTFEYCAPSAASAQSSAANQVSSRERRSEATQRVRPSAADHR